MSDVKEYSCKLCGRTISKEQALKTFEEQGTAVCETCKLVPPMKNPPVRSGDAQNPKDHRQGGFYPVGGNKTVPDSAQVQQWANECGLSLEVVECVQDSKHAHALVRAIHSSGQHVDAIVWHDFDVLKEITLFDMIKSADKRSKVIVSGFDDGKPILTPEAQQDLYNRYIRAKYFASRDCVTKASRIAQLKLLNREFREDEEVNSENMERKLVGDQ